MAEIHEFLQHVSALEPGDPATDETISEFVKSIGKSIEGAVPHIAGNETLWAFSLNPEALITSSQFSDWEHGSVLYSTAEPAHERLSRTVTTLTALLIAEARSADESRSQLTIQLSELGDVRITDAIIPDRFQAEPDSDDSEEAQPRMAVDDTPAAYEVLSVDETIVNAEIQQLGYIMLASHS